MLLQCLCRNLVATWGLGGLSYFAGAEKKDEKVSVPDLGSLTSIYDRFVFELTSIFFSLN